MYEVQDNDELLQKQNNEMQQIAREVKDLEKSLAAAVAAADNSSSFEASIAKAKSIDDLTKARRADPAAFARWQNEADAIAKAADKQPPTPKPSEFQRLVEAIQHNEKLSPRAALAAARKRHPDELKKFQAFE